MTLRNYIREMSDKVIAGGLLTADDALKLSTASGSERYLLFAEAARIRDYYVGSAVHLCSIINAKSGRCPENCAFCAQSQFHSTNIEVYPLVDEDRIVDCAKSSELNGAKCYGIVTSGTGVKPGDELDKICRSVSRIRLETAIVPSCSLGILDYDTALKLKEAGTITYHHNLETARSFFSSICSTHDYEDDVKTIRSAKRAGLKVCCGGLFGLGESFAQRIEMAETLLELDVDSVPMNFLDPVAGTSLANASFLTPMECLKTIAIFRFILPAKNITVCGGRDTNLRELQSWIFMAGASGMMTGNYLTKQGRLPELDRQLLTDLELSTGACA